MGSPNDQEASGVPAQAPRQEARGGTEAGHAACRKAAVGMYGVPAASRPQTAWASCLRRHRPTPTFQEPPEPPVHVTTPPPDDPWSKLSHFKSTAEQPGPPAASPGVGEGDWGGEQALRGTHHVCQVGAEDVQPQALRTAWGGEGRGGGTTTREGGVQNLQAAWRNEHRATSRRRCGLAGNRHARAAQERAGAGATSMGGRQAGRGWRVVGRSLAENLLGRRSQAASRPHLHLQRRNPPAWWRWAGGPTAL